MKVSWNSDRLKELFQRYQAVLLVLAVGLALLLWPQGEETVKTAQDQPEASGESVSAGVQLETLEQRLADALSQVQGVGEATVVLTLESGARQVLATDRKGEDAETVVVSAGSGQEQAVTVQQIAPKFQGALVVCTGGGDPKVKLQVLQAVEALTGLNANQISICEGTGGNPR